MKKHNDWLLFERKEYFIVREKHSIDFDKLLTVNLNSKFFECLYTGNHKFSNVKILRHVLAPYMKDGKPRGWFRGANDEPLRWTGIGNVLYLKGSNAKEAFYALLDALADGKIDEKYLKKQEDFIGFAPMKIRSIL